jgi:hypothetical protein
VLSTRYVLRVAIDPGVNGLGASSWAGRELVDGRYLRGIGGQIHPLLECVPAFEAYCRDLAPIDELIIEIPKVYDSAHQVGDQADLIRLAVVVGALLCAARPYVTGALLVEPSPWKGQVPKPIMRERTILKLTQDELQRIDLPHADSVRHNVWDSVALGRWRACP